MQKGILIVCSVMMSVKTTNFSIINKAHPFQGNYLLSLPVVHYEQFQLCRIVDPQTCEGHYFSCTTRGPTDLHIQEDLSFYEEKKSIQSPCSQIQPVSLLACSSLSPHSDGIQSRSMACSPASWPLGSFERHSSSSTSSQDAVLLKINKQNETSYNVSNGRISPTSHFTT